MSSDRLSVAAPAPPRLTSDEARVLEMVNLDMARRYRALSGDAEERESVRQVAAALSDWRQKRARSWIQVAAALSEDEDDYEQSPQGRLEATLLRLIDADPGDNVIRGSIHLRSDDEL
jgi:hypothetical protein